MADMDIEMDMDIDVGMIDDMAVQQAEVEILPDQPTLVSSVSAPNDLSGPDAEQPTPEKVHIRGLDNLTSKDIKAFANDNYDKNQIVHIEWIDDSSANIVYESPEIAREALLAFSTMGLEEISQMPILQTIPAHPYSKYPDMHLEVRLAVVGDRKQAGARERSRFYLLNPEHDPAERRKNGSNRRGGNRYRERDDDGYRSRRYNDQEQRDREGRDQAGGFDASLYDDDEAALAVRAKRNHSRRESASSGSDSRGRDYRQARFERRGVRKELFPDRGDQGRLLRDRSASPARLHDSAAERNREKARSIKSHLVGPRLEPKELFPQKIGVTSLRSGVFDAADEAADLFARKIPIPLVDGTSDSRPKRDLASRITSRTPAMDGFSIRGTAKASATQNFTIKGTADVRELFPASSNAGKELFSERLEGRGGRRQKAEDLFR